MDEQLKTSYKSVLGTPAGREVMWDILEMTHIYVTSMGDQIQFLEGERNIGLQVLDRLFEVGPDEYTKLLRGKHSD